MTHRFFRRSRGLFLSITVACSSLSFGEGFARVQSLDGQSVDAIPNQVVVGYKENRARQARTSIKKMFGKMQASGVEELGFDVVMVPAGETIESFSKKLAADPNVLTVEPNRVVRKMAAAPNDPDFTAQNNYYLGVSTGINILQAWDISQGTSTVVVAVLDTGVDIDHTDLIPNLWDNPAFPGTHGASMPLDANNDGDCNDALDICSNNNPDDVDGHGTHVAGLIAAATNNGLGMAGVARNCKIMGVRVLNAIGSGTDTTVASGIYYAANNGASVINMSLGSSGSASSIEKAAVAYALEKNVVIVAASGNDSSNTSTRFCGVTSPANIDRVIAVGATDQNNQIAYFSCRGKEMDVVAPGVQILSTNNGGGTSNQLNGDDADGTSFASPIVAGVAALIRSVNPTMPVNDVIRYIAYYASDLGPANFDNTYGYGRVNAYRSLQAASNATPFISNPTSPNDSFPMPNPYNPITDGLVNISLPASLGSNDIKITIYTLAGEPVKTLSGVNTWDGRNSDGNYVASGLYYYFAETDKGNVKGKLTILK